MIHRDDGMGIESTEEYFRRYGLSKEAKTHYKSIFTYTGYKQLTPDYLFKDGDLIPGGFKVIHTPGHTPGHCCFHKSDILISGDIDLVGKPWVSNITSNVDDFHKSINKLLIMDINILLPGHGHPIFKKDKISSELEMYQTKLMDTAKKILDLFEGYLSTEEIINKRDRRRDVGIWNQNPLMKLFQKYDTLNYLEYLQKSDKIAQVEKNRLIFWKKK